MSIPSTSFPAKLPFFGARAKAAERASARKCASFPVHRFHFRRFLGRTKFAVPSTDVWFLRLPASCRFFALIIPRTVVQTEEFANVFSSLEAKRYGATLPRQTNRQKDKTASGKKWDWTRFASRQFSSWCDAGILDSNLARRKSKPPPVVLSSKKLEALLRSLANCTFLWLLLVAQPPPGDATLSQKASSHLPHAAAAARELPHSQTPRSVGRLLDGGRPPFALRGIRPSACLGMGLDANGTAHVCTCLPGKTVS